MKYRREIDGLRAIAVLPVVLFHARSSIMPGGFVGVDVFFVISGYLISSLLLQEHAAGNFSLARFYERRARRILPALLVMMLSCVPFAFFWMLPDDLENFGQSLVATSLFANNILLALTSDYFALQAEFKPLLHTWSLGVEEQFYLFFPLMFLALLRFSKRTAGIILLAIALTSICLAEVAIERKADGAFYHLPTRAWELMAGALVGYLLFSRRDQSEKFSHLAKEVASAVGIAFILGSMLALDKSARFPGLPALLPVTGALLVILFATPETWTGRILGCRFLVGIGLISYSLYLWHQPLFAFARIRSFSEPSLAFYGLLILIACGLAWMTWSFVEQPFRTRAVRSSSAGILALTATASLVGVGIFIDANSGFVARWGELNAGIKHAGRRLNATYNERPFIFRDRSFTPGKRHIMVAGDSFARDFINAGLENDYFQDAELVYTYNLPRCLLGPDDVPVHVQGNLRTTDALVLASHDVPAQCWPKNVAVLSALGANNIVVLGTKNFGWNMNAVMHLSPGERAVFRAEVLASERERNDASKRVLPSGQYVDVLAMLADTRGRVPVFTDSGAIISQDTMHLTASGAKFIGQILFDHPLLRSLR